ncbi:MAG: hypothetical protein ABA06_02705 [Parcubacteria bacterium C7867-001]|nr:MAG: hypothetical protein ABA06_02705 [Parcubacteria bacterium C7867-001]
MISPARSSEQNVPKPKKLSPGLVAVGVILYCALMWALVLKPLLN